MRVARPHLADPAWTLHEAAKLGDVGTSWPKQYLSGRDQLYRNLAKERAAAAAMAGLSAAGSRCEATGAMSVADVNQGPLAGRHAVVTGGSRGIGLAIAQALVEAGANATLMARGCSATRRSAIAVLRTRATTQRLFAVCRGRCR